jgi:hypothetical protein
VRMRWLLLLLLGLNLVYLGWGVYRAQDSESARASPLERAPGVSEIRLIDSLADSPPAQASEEPGLAAGADRRPKSPTISPEVLLR